MAPEQQSFQGGSPAFLDLMDQISRAAVMDRPVLVIGERGTGKELIAARLHFLSTRWNANFAKLNCAALPDTLLESEMFGYEPGAFTGATKRRIGRFEYADGGTLFLDEIATMSAAAQEKLLRVSEYGEFERVGGNDTLTVDVRIIGATNVDLPSAADAGRFRHDLLDRLAFDVITVPPLRDRPEDILVLADHFARKMAAKLEWLVFPGFSDSAVERLMTHGWPGNVRELKNVVERAVYRAWDGEAPITEIILDPFDSPYRPKTAPTARGYNIQHEGKGGAATAGGAAEATVDGRAGQKAAHSPEQGVDRYAALPLRSALAAMERDRLRDALDAAQYNQRKAAKALGLSYDQIRHAAKKHELI